MLITGMESISGCRQKGGDELALLAIGVLQHGRGELTCSSGGEKSPGVTSGDGKSAWFA